MIQTFFNKNILDIFLLLVVCGWLPIQDPSLAKLLLLPVLLFFALRELPQKYARAVSISLLFFWAILEAVHPYNREIIMIWLFSVVALWLGFRKSDKKLDFIALGCGLTAFAVALLDTSGFSNNLSLSLFGSNTSICALLCLFCQPIRERSWRIRLSYALICAITVYFSGSILGIIIYSFGFTYLLVPERHLKLRRLFILVPVISALILIAQPKENYIKAFEKQVSIWQNNFQSWNILGKGPAAAQVLNTKQMSIEMLKQSQPRLEFHPQNDLLFHYHALGAAGLSLRFIIYIVVLSLVLNSALYFPLILFLIQTQFTSDFLALPTGILFFFLMGQALGARHRIEFKAKSTYYWPLLHTIWCMFLIIQLIMCSRYHLNILPKSSTVAPTNQLKFSNPAIQITNIMYLYKLKKWDECLKSIQKHLEIDPFYLYLHLLGADILIQQSKFQEAMEWLKNSRVKLPSSDALKQKESQVLSQLLKN
ncbi:MAG: hypothetical protein VX619_04290 [bacterium]|nr:hypothetical protein [bacterium]